MNTQQKLDVTTEYKGISGIYFKKLLRAIIQIGKLKRENLRVLDFGCGTGELKKIITKNHPKTKVINYDILENLSEIKNWQNESFDIVVANEVFHTFQKDKLESLLLEFKKNNPQLEFIVGISKQSLLNTIGKYLLMQTGSHKYTVLNPKDEINILCRHLSIIDHKSVWYLADVYRLKFK